MLLEDESIPAVRYLTGPDAIDVVRAAAEAMGGEVHDLRMSQVQYRPGSELVARFRTDVTWADGRRRPDDTILAAATPERQLPGTVGVTGTGPDGEVSVSLWRWPFDPAVPGIEAAVTPGGASDLLAPHLGPTTTREVVAYRPTERAVVRVTDAAGATAYLKAVRPADAPGLVERHRRLLDAGLPAPPVLEADPAAGLVLLAELPGPTLRERIKADEPGWPEAGELAALVARIHALDPAGLPHRPGRLFDARGHARLLRAVAPAQADLVDALDDVFRAQAPDAARRSGVAVHGDLHEGQLIVAADGSISGVLDVDDLAAGDPLDDVATVLGHLGFRALTSPSAPRRRLERYIDQLRAAAAERFGQTVVDVGTAAVLVGLATGPFRVQSDDWRAQVDAVLGAAARRAGVDGVDRVDR